LHNVYKLKDKNGGSLNYNKPNTTLIQNYYMIRALRLFNQLPVNIKLMDNNLKFKLMQKTLYMQLFD
jgi:hypothetical protein